MAEKLSETQRRVLSEIDWRGPDADFVRRSTYVKTIESLHKRGLITARVERHGTAWICNLTPQGVQALREQ